VTWQPLGILVVPLAVLVVPRDPVVGSAFGASNEAQSVAARPPLGSVVAPFDLVGIPRDLVVENTFGASNEARSVADNLVALRDLVAGSAFGASSLGHPKYYASPNVCPFPSCASYDGFLCCVFFCSASDALSNDASCSHSSSLVVYLYKKMECAYNSPNLNYSDAIDTISLPTGATTNHCRKRCPHPHQGQHRHMSQVSPQPLEVHLIGRVEVEAEG